MITKFKNGKYFAFTLAEGGRSPLFNLRRNASSHRLLLCATKGTQGSSRLINGAFTLAEVLITLGVIGVVAAVTMPALLTNIQERVRQEQVRTVKYKFTKATEKMNSLGLIGHYDSTMDFVNELKKHMSIAKICDNSKLNECWPSATVLAYSGELNSTTPQTVNVNTLVNGTELKALANTTATTNTVGIVTGDGVPMILVYNTKCSGFDETKQYTWSVENGKPVTNATTNCVSAIFDINGAKGPNKIGTDVRTLNSLFGAARFEGGSYEPADMAICKSMKKKYGFQYCGTYPEDYWVGAMYACDKLGLHLPSTQTLAMMANARYGVNIITPFTIYITSNLPEGQTCLEYYTGTPSLFGDTAYRVQHSDQILCEQSSAVGVDSPISSNFDGLYWSSSEFSTSSAYDRAFGGSSFWNAHPRNGRHKALCLGD